MRWSEKDKHYKDCLNALMLSKQEQLMLELWKAGQRRMFLLNLKKKYAGIVNITDPSWCLYWRVCCTVNRWSKDCKETLCTDQQRDEYIEVSFAKIQCLQS